MANKLITSVDTISTLDTNDSFFVNSGLTLKQIPKKNVLDSIDGISITKVWENAKPTDTFIGQTVKVDLSSYNKVIIIFKTENDITDALISKGYQRNIMYFTHTVNAQTEAIYAWCRPIMEVSDSGITFYDCYLRITNNASYSNKINGQMIPIKIFGIKGVN